MAHGVSGRTVDPAGIVAGLLCLGAAAVVAWDLSSLRLSSTYGLGPKAMPAVVATGLAVLGLANLAGAVRGRPVRDTVDAKAIGLILAGFVVLVASIGLGGGFIVATAFLFAATAAAFGRRAPAVDLAIGFGLALVIYLVFAKLLSLSLPIGPLERFI